MKKTQIIFYQNNEEIFINETNEMNININQ